MKRASSPSSTPSNINGFTLIELMIAVTVLAIMVGIAAPSFTSMIRSNQIVAQTNALLSSINLARSEATKRGVPVVVCSGTGGTCSGTTDWSNGWIVFADSNGNGAFDASEAPAIRVVDSENSGVQVTADNSTVTFQHSGENSVQTTFTLTKTGCGTKQARVIVVALNGLSNVAKQDCP